MYHVNLNKNRTFVLYKNRPHYIKNVCTLYLFHCSALSVPITLQLLQPTVCYRLIVTPKSIKRKAISRRLTNWWLVDLLKNSWLKSYLEITRVREARSLIRKNRKEEEEGEIIACSPSIFTPIEVPSADGAADSCSATELSSLSSLFLIK